MIQDDSGLSVLLGDRLWFGHCLLKFLKPDTPNARDVPSHGFNYSQPLNSENATTFFWDLLGVAIGRLDPAERCCHQGQSQSPEATLQESEGLWLWL